MSLFISMFVMNVYFLYYNFYDCIGISAANPMSPRMPKLKIQWHGCIRISEANPTSPRMPKSEFI